MADRINPGALRERVTFQIATKTVRPSGAVETLWTDEATLRAELVQEQADAFLAGERTEDRKVFRLWKAAFISTELRVVHDDQTYRIARIVPVGPLGLELHCINAVNEVQP